MASFSQDYTLPTEIAACIVGWARVSPSLTWKHPGLPRDWTPVLSGPPSRPTRRAFPGCVYLYYLGEVREIDERALEIIPGSRRPA